jgi:hypothetical protein
MPDLLFSNPMDLAPNLMPITICADRSAFHQTGQLAARWIPAALPSTVDSQIYISLKILIVGALTGLRYAVDPKLRKPCRVRKKRNRSKA